MKNLLLLPIALFFACHVFSQSTTTWFPTGAQWAYSITSLGGPGHDYFEYIGATVQGGQDCIHLHSTTKFDAPIGLGGSTEVFVLARNDSVFVWQEFGAYFKLLYDFTQETGDTIQPLYHNVYQYAVVEYAGDTLWKGIPLRYQQLRLESPGLDAHYTTVYERLGGEHLIEYDIQSPVTEIQYQLYCYRDDAYPIADCIPEPEGPYYEFASGNYWNLNQTAVWSEEKLQWCGFTGYQYKTEGDTTIWGVGIGKKLYYREMYQGSEPCPVAWLNEGAGPWHLIGLIDQSVPYKAVTFTRLSDDGGFFPYNLSDAFPAAGESSTLYNFNLEIGEQLIWKPTPNIVAFIDSMQVDDGTWRQRFFFTDSTGLVDSSYFWLEGIGGSHGLFTSYINPHLLDVGLNFKCLRVNNVIHFSTVDAGFCDNAIVGAEEVSGVDHKLIVCPNPAREGQTTITVHPQALPVHLEVFDLRGKLLQKEVLQQETAQVHLEHLNTTGVLMLHFRFSDGSDTVRMLVLK